MINTRAKTAISALTWVAKAPLTYTGANFAVLKIYVEFKTMLRTVRTHILRVLRTGIKFRRVIYRSTKRLRLVILFVWER